jgi:hypothetical protein
VPEPLSSPDPAPSSPGNPAGDATGSYTQLEADKVLETVRSLRARIGERFPESGLSRICGELETVCARSKERIEGISQPIWPLRIVRYALLILIPLGIGITFVALRPSVRPAQFTLLDLIQTLESGINDVVMIGVAVFFVWTLESRLKSRRALRALHELRSIAHVIDMHQLTKDPHRLLVDRRDTASSPKMTLTNHELKRYLDYCSEMLSLVSKVAALHLQKLDDATVVAAVNEIEALTTGLSGKIWQKIDMVDRRIDP